MTPEQKIALLKDVARLAPKEWSVVLGANGDGDVHLCVQFETNGQPWTVGIDDHAEAFAAFALLEWLGPDHHISFASVWECWCESSDMERRAVFHDPEPVWAVLQAVRARLTNPERGGEESL